MKQELAAESAAFSKNCQRLGIYSCTTRPDNQPMWAYYCNDSRGICLELEWPDDLVKEYELLPTFVSYSASPRLHDRFDDMQQAIRALAKRHPDWTAEELLEHSTKPGFIRNWMIRSMGRAVSTKHLDWAHEQELRMISPTVGALPILKRLLRRVYFTRTDFPEWGPIMMILHQLYPEVELARVDFSHTEPLVSVVPLAKKLIPVIKRASAPLDEVEAPPDTASD
ncbi:DUF2971 domain-containing protein [Ideonella sp. B508-1]|uniref:DUF2971 domain-containing protein n=1 Tax=Ideonella sp. B508-1 TaxID=137716 RepID=UPI000347C98F|nr:DUF2971 domain-containing protein [Ideonella sp. B508-1]